MSKQNRQEMGDEKMTKTMSVLGQTLTPYSVGNSSNSAFSMPGVDVSPVVAPSPHQHQQQLQQLNSLAQFQQIGPLVSVPAQMASAASSPQTLMNALSILQQNIGALQALVPILAQQQQHLGAAVNAHQAQQLQQQQAAASAGVASVISQLAMAAANILPQMGITTHSPAQAGFVTSHLSQTQLPQMYQQMFSVSVQHEQQETDHVQTAAGQNQSENMQKESNDAAAVSVDPLPGLRLGQPDSDKQAPISQQPSGMPPSKRSREAQKDADEISPADDEPEDNLPEDIDHEIVEMDPVEILAEHTHFCEICGKGFKRDANLRMHMRGHGDEYKTHAALSRPDKRVADGNGVRFKRFSCPFVGCKRNKTHRKFQPLKTMLCVKNHYRRSHCPKMLTCSKCGSKKFSVVADLKTHEKHCGNNTWMCSCNTTFSRKDKLLGHLALFSGHYPAVQLHTDSSFHAVPSKGANTPAIPSESSSSSLNLNCNAASKAINTTESAEHEVVVYGECGNKSAERYLLNASASCGNDSLRRGGAQGQSTDLVTTNFLDAHGGLR